jgi:hypothetical protein
MEEARCGAVFTASESEVAHASRRLLTLRLETCSLFTLFTTTLSGWLLARLPALSLQQDHSEMRVQADVLDRRPDNR